jgi:ferrous iron transport protein A
VSSATPLLEADADRSPPPRPTLELRLADLEPGAGAIVARVVGESGLAERLLDLGFLPGTPVRVVRRAPLGDPTLYELRGYRLCLRRAEGMRIRVSRA